MCGCTQNHVRTGPMDQCPDCLKKHFDEAYECFHEFLYTDANRDHIHGQLRSCVCHSYLNWPGLAADYRELAQLVLNVRDSETAGLWNRLRTQTDAVYYAAHPDAAERLKQLEHGSANEHLV